MNHSHRISLAPMVDRTDRHFRTLMSLVAPKVLLYTEMHPTPAILRGKVDEILRQPEGETNCVLQIASDNPDECFRALKLADERFNYSEYNLNVGCPSKRVQKSSYGATLMRDPILVKEMLIAMQEATDKPVSAKIRMGIKKKLSSIDPPDNLTSWENLVSFVETIAQSGIKTIQAHARIAILEGLSPKDNRQIPPLQPEWVYELAGLFPEIAFIMNGQIKTIEQIQEVLDKGLPGVMIGREAYDNPYLMARASRIFLGETSAIPTRREVLESMHEYFIREEEAGTRIKFHFFRHLMGLYHEEMGSSAFRQILSEPYTNGEKCSPRFEKIFKTLPAETLDKPIGLEL